MNSDLQNITQKLKALRKPIREEYKAEIIGIFGSYVRGEEHPGSDLDILARFHQGASIFDLSGLSIFLKEELKIPVDVVSERAVRDELRTQIYQEALML